MDFMIVNNHWRFNMKFIIFAYFTKFFENLKNKTTLVGYNDFFFGTLYDLLSNFL